MDRRTLTIGHTKNEEQKSSSIMKAYTALIMALSSLLMAGCLSQNPETTAEGSMALACGTPGHVERIGSYDSRAVALTFVKSGLYGEMVAGRSKDWKEQ
jgi:hypothetical protein